jgi:hypothetical protein
VSVGGINSGGNLIEATLVEADVDDFVLEIQHFEDLEWFFAGGRVEAAFEWDESVVQADLPPLTRMPAW